MTSTINLANGNRRFDALLEGTSQEASDRPLLERPSWIVAPTIGAIVADWLLVIPRMRALSFRDWATSTGESPGTILRELQAYLGLSPSEMIWFEHGPSLVGTSVGCGTDHAHLHVLVRPKFDFETFASEVRASSSLEWHDNRAGYDSLKGNASYFIAGCGDAIISASHVESAGSQFFRRVVATLVELNSEWDYRQHPNAANVARTIKTFRSLEGAAKRGD